MLRSSPHLVLDGEDPHACLAQGRMWYIDEQSGNIEQLKGGTFGSGDSRPKREYKRTQATLTKREVGCYFEGLMRGRPLKGRANVPYRIIPEAFVQSRPDTRQDKVHCLLHDVVRSSLVPDSCLWGTIREEVGVCHC